MIRFLSSLAGAKTHLADIQHNADKTKIASIQTNSVDLDCCIQSDGQPCIKCKNEIHHTIQDLLKAHPNLGDLNHLEPLAKATVFLTKGAEFQLIEDVETFKRSYINDLAEEDRTCSMNCDFLTDMALYNTEVIKTPHVERGVFVFYVKDRCNIPYCVRCTYPMDGGLEEITYELLPILEEN